MNIPDPRQVAALALPEILRLMATYLVAPENGEPDEMFALTDATPDQDTIYGGEWTVTLVTVASPIGQVLADAAIGEDIEVRTPEGVWRAQIIARDGTPPLSPEERQAAREAIQVQRHREAQAAEEQAKRDQLRRDEQNRRDLESDTVRELRERRRAVQAETVRQDRERRLAWEATKTTEAVQ